MLTVKYFVDVDVEVEVEVEAAGKRRRWRRDAEKQNKSSIHECAGWSDFPLYSYVYRPRRVAQCAASLCPLRVARDAAERRTSPLDVSRRTQRAAPRQDATLESLLESVDGRGKGERDPN